MPRKNKPSASGLFRLFLCPGSWQAEQAAPIPEPSADAALGTLLHAHMQHGTDPADPDHADALLWCRTQEYLLLESLFPAEQPPLCERETRLWNKDATFSGQQDVLFYNEETALIIDYKFGRLPVEPAGTNTQLLALCLLTLEALPTLSVVHAAILAPYVSRATPTIVTYTRADEQNMRTLITNAINRAAQPNAPLVPSLHACRYCRAAATCPAAEAHALTCNQITNWSLLPVTDRAELYRRAQLAKSLAARIEAACKEDLLAGVEIPGLTLKPGKTTRKLHHSETLAALCAHHNVPPSAFCAPSLPQLEKAFHAACKATNPKYTAKQAKEDLAAALADSITTTTTAPFVAEL